MTAAPKGQKKPAVKKTPAKKTTKSVEKKTEPVTEPETVTETVTETAPDTESKTDSDEKVDPTVESITNLISKFELFEKESKLAKVELRKVLKSYQKKTSKKTRKHDPNRPPTGFAKPSLISEELCKFLNKPSGTKMARTEVTQEVNKYIKAHNLQNPANKKEIKADSTLSKLLNLKKDDDLNYFSLQKYLKDHFPKTDSSVSA